MPFPDPLAACPYLLGPKNTPQIFGSAIQQPDSWRAITSCINFFIGYGTEAHLSNKYI
jgi:hypothetical protein